MFILSKLVKVNIPGLQSFGAYMSPNMGPEKGYS
jgi:hypothetical protein